MKIIVVGGSGFLGSHVSDKLTEHGHNVIIYDQTESKWINSNQEMVLGSINNLDSLIKTFKDADAVYNFAAISDLNEALTRPIDTININILGNANVLEACKINNVKRYIYSSSIYVQSREGGFYKCSKQAAENYIEEYHHTYGLNYTILRFGSLYGPRSDHHNGLWRIVKKAIENNIIEYDGSSEAIREYIHVHDASRASVESLTKEFENKHFVLTGHESLKVYDLLKMLGEILNIKSDIKFTNTIKNGHYITTPYAYQPKIGLKYTSNFHTDLGQGLIELITEINNKI
jgi:UDP-glucose 4-epimerase